MDQDEIIRKVHDYIKENSHNDTAHDWWHIHRVYELSQKICKKEKGDIFIVSMIALLHDVFDWKINPVENEESVLREFLSDIGVKEFISETNLKIIVHDATNISFKGGGCCSQLSLAGQIAQDADRLDAIGAIGIARVFTYGGKINREIYNPESNINANILPEEYQNLNRKSHTIGHFYEKLLKLKELINTETGKKMADRRHKFMEKYLDEFYKEWEGKK